MAWLFNRMIAACLRWCLNVAYTRCLTISGPQLPSAGSGFASAALANASSVGRLRGGAALRRQFGGQIERRTAPQIFPREHAPQLAERLAEMAEIFKPRGQRSLGD